MERYSVSVSVSVSVEGCHCQNEALYLVTSAEVSYTAAQIIVTLKDIGNKGASESLTAHLEGFFRVPTPVTYQRDVSAQRLASTFLTAPVYHHLKASCEDANAITQHLGRLSGYVSPLLINRIDETIQKIQEKQQAAEQSFSKMRHRC